MCNDFLEMQITSSYGNIVTEKRHVSFGLLYVITSNENFLARLVFFCCQFFFFTKFLLLLELFNK